MSFTFVTPVWDSKLQTYKIMISSPTVRLSSAPQYIDISSNGAAEIEHPDMTSSEAVEVVSQFIKALLLKDSQENWFSTRLRESSILKKLEHKWELNSTVVPTHNWIRAVWAMNSLEITTKGFTLRWMLLRFESAQPQISSRFLPALSAPQTPRSASPEPDVKQITIQPTAEMNLDELEVGYDIPYANDRTMNLQEQMNDRHALQEARLRLALAKLKAERLKNAYFSKYGEEYSEEEDSELSESESEEER